MPSSRRKCARSRGVTRALRRPSSRRPHRGRTIAARPASSPSAPSSSRCPPAPPHAAARSSRRAGRGRGRRTGWSACARRQARSGTGCSRPARARVPRPERAASASRRRRPAARRSRVRVVGEGALTGRQLDQAGTQVLTRDPLAPPHVSRALGRPRPLEPAVVAQQVHLHARDPIRATVRRPTRRRAGAEGHRRAVSGSYPTERGPRRRSRRPGAAPETTATRRAASPGRPGRLASVPQA